MGKRNPYLAEPGHDGDGMIIPLSSYIQFLWENRRKSAARTYEMMLRPFARWLAGRGKTLDTFTQNDVEMYRRRFDNPNTSNMFFYSIRGYANYRTGALDFGDPRVIEEMQRANQLRLMRPEKPMPNAKKKYLTSDELRRFLARLRKDRVDPAFYSGCVCQFYFGARPIELAYHLKFGDHKAEINWRRNEMVLYTAKRGSMRYLAWDDLITPHLRRWYDALPLEPPGEWLTRRLRKYVAGGIRLTSYTGRYSLQTHLRLARVDELLINSIMGHTSDNDIDDGYTSWDAFYDDIRQVMSDGHYMIRDGILDG